MGWDAVSLTKHKMSTGLWLRRLSFAGAIGLILLGGGCATDEGAKDGAAKDPVADTKGEGPSDNSDSGALKKGIVSLSNNPMTLHTVDRGKGEETAARLAEAAKGGGANEKKALRGALAAQRLAGLPIEKLIDTAKRMVDVEMKQSVDRELPTEAKLELAYGALRQKKYALAEFLFEDVRGSKMPRYRAGAAVGQGLIAMSEDRVPEAMVLWKEALKEVADFEAAKFNVGFLSLKYGDYKTAGRMLNGIDDLFAQYGMISVHRLGGETKAAEKLCDKVLETRPNFKPALMNCALVEYQGNQNFAKAKQLLTKMVKAPGGDPKFDEEAYRILSSIETEEGLAKRAKPEGSPEKKDEK